MKYILLFIALLCTSTHSFASTTDSENTSFLDGLIQTGTWGKPFWADTHSTISKAELAVATNVPTYDWGETGEVYRPYIFANLGTDFPVWSGNFSNGKYGLSVTMPFFIEVWLDMFERETAPVINTSYRFGAPEFNFIYRFDNAGFFKNFTVRLVPFKHECTHIGDEIALRNADAELAIKRVNVSYNYNELQITINDPDGRRGANHAFRVGMLATLDKGSGWYSYAKGDANNNVLKPSDYPYEAYFQYQYQSDEFWGGLQLMLSAEMRVRPKYGYPYYEKDLSGNWYEVYVEEYLSYNFNYFAGLRYSLPENNSALYYTKVGLGLHVYTGINPHGQFRSIPYFQQLGLALIFE